VLTSDFERVIYFIGEVVVETEEIDFETDREVAAIASLSEISLRILVGI
jgi:hypothetical protein